MGTLQQPLELKHLTTTAPSALFPGHHFWHQEEAAKQKEKRKRKRKMGAKKCLLGQPARNVIWSTTRCGPVIIILTTLWAAILLASQQQGGSEALRITNFRVPSYVPITLPTQASISKQQGPLAQQQTIGGHPLDLAKPILFDCDYDYKPDEDARLTVRWFRNKEPEPFYQWLPELGERHLADWIRPLVNQTFVSDPLDPKKRYRSLLIKRLSMNLTGHYACVVSSLANQDTKQASLVVYQPPHTFTFKQTIYPAPASMPPRNTPPLIALTQAPTTQHFGGPIASELEQSFRPGASPTQFRGYHLPASGQKQEQQQQQLATSAIIRPPNNNNNNVGASQTPTLLSLLNPAASSLNQQQQAENTTTTRIVYTHDGRPIRRKFKRQATPIQPPISGWMLRKKLAGSMQTTTSGGQQEYFSASEPKFTIQLHHFQCQATQVTPRPVIVLTVKRGADSIAQYLHESSTTSIRPYQVNHADYFESSLLPSPLNHLPESSHLSNSRSADRLQVAHTRGGNLTTTNLADDSRQQQQLLVTLYDITVSATVALNVSLQPPQLGPPTISGLDQTSGNSQQQQQQPYMPDTEMYQQLQQPNVNTVLSFRRGQRMSFECHLEITGTEFEQRKRININEEEVYQFAEAEERKRKLRLQVNGGQFGQEEDKIQDLDQEAGPSLRFASSSSNGSFPVLYWKACFCTHLLWIMAIILTNLRSL